MSSPAAQLPSDPEGSIPSNDGSQSSTQLKPKDSTLYEAATDQLLALIASLRSPADGKCIDDLGSDGVYRVLQWLPTPPDQPTGIKVYDAKPMSPEIIKAFLDRQAWSQVVEDRFRGVDGRTVPQEQWMNPPQGIIPPMGTKNERLEEMRKWNEERAQLEEKVARREISKDALGPACDSVKSDYDLRPR
ncbi:uncharacterized protein K460DRAFT_377655 [Cucurbitaria berberidis CBS 394.84]|uniref:Uncharacterized protein n=1 Tax=Cucurbitaria berberidis CBS 394.84 TaxID=1168544 RepID=A0A9P4GJP7_9PLEO|nr:uncharacterized protein K460DRAFT_377655 [Cucurbitaria berberidis CBS 394.84]KAF1846459.1 hypothetical protein K460DRAFT_377655 [Cucurbitaria berberidis CBS 394.84]